MADDRHLKKIMFVAMPDCSEMLPEEAVFHRI